MEYFSIVYKEDISNEDQHFYGLFRVSNVLTGELELYRVDGEGSTEEEVKAAFDEQVAKIRKEAGGGNLFYLECKCDGLTAFEKLMEQSWVTQKNTEFIAQPEPDMNRLLGKAEESTDKFGD